MKYFTIIFLIFQSLCLLSQKAKLKIYPSDDCSKISESYKSLYNDSEYFFGIEGSKENVDIQVDSNFIFIEDDILIIRFKIGKTFIRLIDHDSKSIVYETFVDINVRPKINLETDLSELKEKGIVKFHPVDELGNDLSTEFKIAYMSVHYYDNQNLYLYSVPVFSSELYFKLTGNKIAEVNKIRIETLVLSEENGLCFNIPDKLIEVRNVH
jgi:hypothetical protein